MLCTRSLALLCTALLYLKRPRLLVDGIVGEVSEPRAQVPEAVLLGREPHQPLLEQVHPQRLHARHQHVQPEVELATVDQHRVVDVPLFYYGVSPIHFNGGERWVAQKTRGEIFGGGGGGEGINIVLCKIGGVLLLLLTNRGSNSVAIEVSPIRRIVYVCLRNNRFSMHDGIVYQYIIPHTE